MTFASVGNTRNERGVANAIEGWGGSSDLYAQIISMDAVSTRNAYDNLSGEIHGSVKSALLTNTRYARNAVLQHLDTNTCNDEQKDVNGRNVKSGEACRNLWVNAWGHDGHLKADSNAAKLDNKGWGFLAGADLYDNGRDSAGVALGYEQNDLKARDNRNSDADVNAIHALVYGRTAVGPVNIKGGIGYSWLDVDTTRHVSVGSVVSTNKASYHGNLYHAFVTGSHDFAINERATVTPYVGFSWQHVKTNGFTEHGSDPGSDSLLRGNSGPDNYGLFSVGAKGKWSLDNTKQCPVCRCIVGTRSRKRQYVLRPPVCRRGKTVHGQRNGNRPQCCPDPAWC